MHTIILGVVAVVALLIVGIVVYGLFRWMRGPSPTPVDVPLAQGPPPGRAGYQQRRVLPPDVQEDATNGEGAVDASGVPVGYIPPTQGRVSTAAPEPADSDRGKQLNEMKVIVPPKKSAGPSAPKSKADDPKSGHFMRKESHSQTAQDAADLDA